MRQSTVVCVDLFERVTSCPATTLAPKEIKAPCAFTTRVRVSSSKFSLVFVVPFTRIGTLRSTRMLRRRPESSTNGCFSSVADVRVPMMFCRLKPGYAPCNRTKVLVQRRGKHPVHAQFDGHIPLAAANGPLFKQLKAV